jgi:folylpolyglutamate synthase/dihydropteroate synthase
MKALGKHLKLMKEKRNISILFSCLYDKDVSGMLDILEDLSDRIIITEFPDVRFKSLKEFIRPGMSYNEDAMGAYKRLLLERDETNNIYIVGSLHFASFMLKEILKDRREVYEMNEKADRIEFKHLFNDDDELDIK